MIAASINDKKARDMIIKGPLKLNLVLETIELDNYNRKYGDRCTKSKRLQKNSSDSSSEEDQVGHTKQMPRRHFANVCRSKLVNRIQEEVTGSNTEPWPEIDHIQSINGVNRVDFCKAILLVEGQPIDCIIDTGSPVTIIPPTINPKNMKATPRCYVDVNRNPIKFKDEAMVEVKTERSRVTLPILIAEKGNTQPLLGLDWLDKFDIGSQGNRETNIIRNIEVNERGEKIFKDYENLF